MTSLWNRNFTAYTTGIFFSMAGDAISIIALAALIYQETGKTYDIAIIFSINAAVSLLGPFFGKLIDKINIRILLAAVDFARAISICIFLITIEYFGTHSITIYCFAVISSILALVYRPSVGAFLPILTGKHNLVQANSVLGMIHSSTGIFGYFLGGVIVAFLGVKIALWIDAATFLAMALVFLTMRSDMFVKKEVENRENASALNMGNYQAFRFMLQSGIIIVPLMIVAGSVALAPFRVEWPEFLTEIGGGVLFASVSFGAVIAYILIYKWKDLVLNQRLITSCLLLTPFLVSVPIISTEKFLFPGIGLLLGFCTSFASSLIYSSVQVRMPDRQRGQIFGLMEPMEKLPVFVVYVAIAQLGMRLDLVHIFFICATLTVLLMAVVTIVMNNIKLFESIPFK